MLLGCGWHIALQLLQNGCPATGIRRYTRLHEDMNTVIRGLPSSSRIEWVVLDSLGGSSARRPRRASLVIVQHSIFR